MENKDFSYKEKGVPNREAFVDQILNRGIIVDVLPDKESFRQRLLSREPMKIYIGADPTSTALHLSHAKNYMLLEEFRELGHEVIILFGDFTARIGDPTGRSKTRKQLSSEDVALHVKAWIKQIKPLMDLGAEHNPPRVVYNSNWLSKLTMDEVVNLASNVTVQQMLERDMFAKRLGEEQPISLHEFLYPLMQGYDSVALDVDAEVCGTDQLFNALLGRTLLKRLKKKDKFVVTVNLMENPRTHELMSKSRGIGVFLDLDPFNMYGSIMSQPDEMIKILLINNTRIPLDEIESIMKIENPRDAKMRTAFEITRIFHGEDRAIEAQDTFVNLVQNRGTADNVPQVRIPSNSSSLLILLKECMPGISNSEIRRLLEQNAVKINGVVVNKSYSIISIPEGGLNVKIGRKKWFRVTFQ